MRLVLGRIHCPAAMEGVFQLARSRKGNQGWQAFAAVRRRGKGVPAAVLRFRSLALGTSTAALEARAHSPRIQNHSNGTEESIPLVICSHRGTEG